MLLCGIQTRRVKMAPRKKTKSVKDVAKAVASVKDTADAPVESDDFDFGKVISTGSTLLDLAISGKRIRGGGIPGGILVSIQGKSSAGKSALLAEMAASVQIRGGETRFLDTEARLDRQFAKVFGMSIPEESILLSDCVEDMFSDYAAWVPGDDNEINLYAVDSLSALCSRMEMDDKDLMGTKKAKVLSEGFRKYARHLQKSGNIMACTNQLRQTMTGQEKASGGNAQGFHSSLTLSVKPRFAGGSKIVKKKKLPSGKTIEKQVGTYSEVSIIKSSIDDPFRKAEICIKFESGIDDVSMNLQYLKTMQKTTAYDVYDKTIASLEKAAIYIEEHDYEDRLREDVINMWEATEALFASGRKKKVRR